MRPMTTVQKLMEKSQREGDKIGKHKQIPTGPINHAVIYYLKAKNYL